MEPFLARVATHLSSSPTFLGSTCVVLPNRRAGLYLKRYLAQTRTAPFWAPEVMSIEDFIYRLHGTAKVDRLRLLMLFYRHYRGSMGESAEVFKSFIRWAEPLVDDFNDIDFYLVDPEGLFAYLSDARALERWSPDTDELTELQSDYLKFYRSLADMHRGLKREVLEEGLSWPGLAAREVLSRLHAESFSLGWDKVVFAGLNALSPAEKGIIEELENRGLAETLWDADLYYLKDKNQEAGMFMRERWSGKDRHFRWAVDELGEKEADITITGVPGRIGQVRKAGDILHQWLTHGWPADEHTAVVLADESLLLPLLNSLPKEADPINVTMGLPLSLSPAFSFFNSWISILEDSFSMHERKPSADLGYRMRLLLSWFSHPWASMLASTEGDDGRGVLSWIIGEARLTGRVIMRSTQLNQGLNEFLGEDKLWPILFPVQPYTPLEALNAARGLVELLRSRISQDVIGNDGLTTGLDMEYLFSVHQILTRLTSLIGTFGVPEDIPSLRIVFNRIAASQRLPLSGEPLQGLQVMGVLETRALDFDRVILLSANEDILPAGKHSSTFIPMDIRRDFGLPSVQERTAVFAYHFWRLMQYPAEIHILYDTEEGKLGSGEPSRFLRQIEHEWIANNPQLRIRFTQEGLMPRMKPVQPFVVPKSEATLERLLQMAEYGLSASALSDFRACTLKFYLKRVLRLEEGTPDPEEIGANVPGTLVHRVLEELFKPWIGLQPGSEDIRGMQSRAEGHTHRAFLSEFSGREHSDGRNHLLYHQAVELVNHFLRAEAARVAETAFPPKIIALEDQVIVNYELGIPETGDLLKVKLRGKSDRIEEVAGERRVIDYKTGKVEAKELIFSGSDKVDSPKGDKIFQLMFYELLYHIHAPDLPVKMMILSLRNLSEGPLLLKGEMGEWTEMDRERFKEYLNGMLISMLDRDVPFSPTEDTDHCKYCDFRELCYRTGKSEA